MFSGGFRFEEGKLIATSVDATYQVAKGALALRGGPAPRVRTSRTSGSASTRNTIDVTLSPRQMSASRQRPHRTSAPAAANRASAGPHCSSEKEGGRRQRRESRVRRGDRRRAFTRVRRTSSRRAARPSAPTQSRWTKVGILTATGNVVTALPIAGPQEQRSARPPRRAGRASFAFDDAKRQVVFTKRRSSKACRETCAPIASSCPGRERQHARAARGAGVGQVVLESARRPANA